MNQKAKSNHQAWVSHFNVGQFARIYTSSLIDMEKILNRPVTKFYNGDDLNVIAAELRLTKTMRVTAH